MKDIKCVPIAYIILIIITIISFVTVLSTAFPQKSLKILYAYPKHDVQPILMIPGSYTSENRFDEMLNKINPQQKHSVIKLIVNHQKIKQEGGLKPQDTRPFIILALKHNSNSRKDLNTQIKETYMALQYLHQRYLFTKCNLLGHSNGGIIWTRFLEKYQLWWLRPQTLITIATPYKNQIINYQTMIQQNHAIPNNINVVIIAGNTRHRTDGTVSVNDVKAGKKIFKQQRVLYQEISGVKYSHSRILTQPYVLQILKKYL